MDCKIAQTLLEAYLDNELDRADARELEAHMDTCTQCSSALGRLDDLRRALRDASLRYAAPPALHDRIRATASAAEAMPGRHGWRSAPGWLRLAAACVLAFGAGGLSMRMWNDAPSTAGTQAQMTRDLFAAHWRALAAVSPVDVISTDRHTVKPWFAGKVAQAPPVQDFADQGFALAGGRIDYVGAQRVAVLVYRHGQHLIDVFALPNDATRTLPRETGLQGYTLDTVTLGDQPAAVVTDMDAIERARFLQLLGTKPQ
jgi:anti-sigma factor RsiW